MQFQCTCGAMLVSDNPPGSQVQCPTCGQLLIVPAPQQGQAPPPAPQPGPPPPQAAAQPEGELIRFNCPCGKPLRTRRPAGTQARCPRCGQIVIVPAAGQVAATASTGESAFIPPQPPPPPPAPAPQPAAPAPAPAAAPAPAPALAPAPVSAPAPAPAPKEPSAPADILSREVDPAQLAATTPLPGLGSVGQAAQPAAAPQAQAPVPDTTALSSSPGALLQLQCECGTTLETDQPPGTSVQCPNCNRLLVVPSDESAAPGVGYPPPEEGIEFQCVCGCTLASSEPPGSEVQCPSCGRMVVVPHDMGETQQVVAEMVAAAAAPPPPPPPAPAGRMREFSCSCGAVLASAEPPGTEVTCPTCQRIVVVPGAAGPSAPAPVVAPPPATGQQNLGVYILIGVAILVVAIVAVGVILAIILKPAPAPQGVSQPASVTTTAPLPTTTETATGAPAEPAKATPAAPGTAPAPAAATQPAAGTAATPVPAQKVEEVSDNVEGAGNVTSLAEQLGSDKEEVRDEAEEKLGGMGEAAVAALRDALTRGKDADVRTRAARALKNIGKGSSVGALMMGLKDKEAAVRKTCARSLGSIASEAASALPALIDALTDADLDVRTTALDALVSIGDHTVDRQNDTVETNPKQLQDQWRKWFEGGAKPDVAGGGGEAQQKKEAAVKMHTHMHVHVDGTRHKHEHPAAEHEPDFDVGSGLAHHGPQEGNEPATETEDEGAKKADEKKPEAKKEEKK